MHSETRTKVMAIDPGPRASSLVVWDGECIVETACARENNFVLFRSQNHAGPVVIEMVACYGMPVGAEVFETCVFIGRLLQAAGERSGGIAERLTRLQVKQHICHDSRAKDANIRQALIDRLGAPGTKAAPGTTYGIKSHLWQALALAVTWWDHNAQTKQPPRT